MKTQKLNIKVRDLTPLLGKSRKTMIEGRNLMKNITLIMCFIAALAIFVLPVDAATRVKQSIPITLSVPVVCNVGEVVDLSGRLHAVITFRRLPFLSAHVDVNTQGVAGTGEITGRTYQGNGTIHTISLGSPLLNGQATLSTRVAFLVTGAPGPDGSVPSFDLQADLHLRFRANGTVTVKFDNFTTDCGDGAGFWDCP
jgi:hypothetical protein